MNKVSVNWDGKSRLADQNYRIRDALDCYCTRTKKNASPNSAGVCGATDGSTQTGWNIKWFYMFAGAKGTLYSAVLPGQDDEAVAYHSAGGMSGSGGAGLCNPSDWLCNDLTLGTAANQGGSAKWTYHSVKFRDDSESLNHYTNGSWGGVLSKVRADMATYAN